MMALAVAEQFPGVQGCWEVAQSHVDIGSGQGCYETRWEMGNKVELSLPPVSALTTRVCRGCPHTGVTGSLAGMGQAAVDPSAGMHWWCALHTGTALLALHCSRAMDSLGQENSLSSAETCWHPCRGAGRSCWILRMEPIKMQPVLLDTDWLRCALPVWQLHLGGDSSPDTLQDGHWHRWKSGFNALMLQAEHFGTGELSFAVGTTTISYQVSVISLTRRSWEGGVGKWHSRFKGSICTKKHQKSHLSTILHGFVISEMQSSSQKTNTARCSSYSCPIDDFHS